MLKSSKFMSAMLASFIMLGANMASSASYTSSSSHSSSMGLTRPSSSGGTSTGSSTASPSSSSMGLTRPSSSGGTSTSSSTVSPTSSTPSMMGLTRPGSSTSKPDVAGQPATAPNSLGLTRPTAPVSGVAANDNRKPPMTAADQAVTARMSNQSLASYRADQNRSKQPPIPINTAQAQQNPTFNQATGRYTSMDSYYSDRNRSMDTFRSSNQNAVMIVQNMHPNYGVWDALFLAAIFSNMERPGYSDWAYAHRNDPSVQQFRQEAEENAELKAQMASVNARMSQMEASNANPSMNLPPDINPAMAIAPEAIATSSTIQMSSNPFETNGKPDPLPDAPVKKGMGIFTILLIVLVVAGGAVVALRYLRPRRSN